MKEPTLLWIDLRRRRVDSALAVALAREVPLRYLFRVADVAAHVERDAPGIFCFDLDFPGAGELRAIERTRRAWPGMPVLVLSEAHSEALFVWALRVRVWDCLIKPVPVDALRGRVRRLVAVLGQGSRRHRTPVLPGDCPEPGFAPTVRAGPERVLLPALRYVEQHFAEPVRLRTVAALCGRSDSEFSRLFHRTQGTTFRAYLLRLRLLKARDLLRVPGVSVSDVGMRVGFRDASYFARMFRRETGQTPSQFRRGTVSPDA